MFRSDPSNKTYNMIIIKFRCHTTHKKLINDTFDYSGWLLLFHQKRLSVVHENRRTRATRAEANNRLYYNSYSVVNQFNGNLWILIYSFVIGFCLSADFSFIKAHVLLKFEMYPIKIDSVSSVVKWDSDNRDCEASSKSWNRKLMALDWEIIEHCIVLACLVSLVQRPE